MLSELPKEERVAAETYLCPLSVDALKAIHPDAAEYVRLLMEGYTQKEILGNPPKGIPSMLPTWDKSPSAWDTCQGRGPRHEIQKLYSAVSDSFPAIAAE
jgi:hypothetical protein